MNVVTSGFEYEVATSDLTTYPTGVQPILFEKDDGAGLQDGITSSLEMIDVLIDRFTYLATTAEDDSATCSLDYLLAAKACEIVRRYVDREE